MEALGIDIKYLIFQIINFSILLFLLTKFLHKPLMSILDKRNAEIEQSLKNAEQIKLEMQESQKKQVEILNTAKIEASKIFTEAKKEATILAETITINAQEKAEKLISKAEENIITQKEQMKEELKEEIAYLALKISEKIIGEELSAEKKKESLSKISKQIK